MNGAQWRVKRKEETAARRGRRAAWVLVAAWLLMALVAGLFLVGCGKEETGGTTSTLPITPTTGPGTTAGPIGERKELVLMTHDSFAVSESVLARFEASAGVKVKVLKAGDAGSMLNQAILAKGKPLADVIYGIDNTFLSRALKAGIIEAYKSPLLASVPDAFELDPEHRVTPIDFGDVALNYDKEEFKGSRQPPSTLRDLARPEYRSLLVVENPATSSPGLAFLLATIAEFGETGGYTWKDFWRELKENDVLVTSGWEEAYYSAFSGGSGKGNRPLVVSYASSPPAEVVFAEKPLTEAPTGVITAGSYRQIEFAGILKGTKARESAAKLIDFMLSTTFQEDIPLKMFVFPVNENAKLPAEFIKYTVVPERPASMDPQLIEQNRERWIREWTSIVMS